MTDQSDRTLLIIAGVLGATGVAIGAFGAHGLSDRLMRSLGDADLVARRVAQFDVGARYHLVHAAAVLALAACGAATNWRRWIGIGLAVGTVIFSGSLYLLVLLEIPRLGAITPIGGLIWILSWSMLAVAAWRN